MTVKLSDDAFIRAWNQNRSSPALIAKATGLDIAHVYRRRRSLEKKGVVLRTIPTTPSAEGASRTYGFNREATPFSPSMDFTVRDGVAIIFGDCHYWPGEPSLAHQALVLLAKELKPKLVCANGDVFDGAGVSRHEPLGWVKLPTVVDELDIVKTRLGEIERAAPKAQRFLSPGNHCTRFDRRLATEVPEFAGIPGMRLEDHLKGWPMAYVGVINRDIDPVLVMHNYRGGVHAPHHNVVNAGATIVTGHLHAQDVKGHTNYFKTSYGVDHGVLADPDHDAFSYTMGRPKNWRSGFCVLTFDKQGRHLPPELCTIQNHNGHKRAVFRGRIILEARPRAQAYGLNKDAGRRIATAKGASA